MSDLDKDLTSKIKEMEQQKRSTKESVKPTLVHFESWFHQRKPLIHEMHKKEILQADFKARGVELEATMEQFDKALRLYGVKI